MTKSYRAYLKIQRDKERKAIKRKQKVGKYDNYESLITYQNFCRAYRKCLKNVSWKYSVQAYKQNAAYEIDQIINQLLNYNYPELKNIIIKNIYERGKRREIHSVHIRDRVPQRALCDDALLPLLKDTLIYDNGASLAGKGTDFTRRRLNKHLVNAVKEYGTDFYVLKFDFKDFFNSIPHKLCRDVLSKYIQDERIIWMTMEVIKSYARVDVKKADISQEEKEYQLQLIENDLFTGLCLGSQVSQVMALIVANELDHYVKDQCGFKHYIRYMDDGIVIAKAKEELQLLYSGMVKIVDKLGLQFNEKKTNIAHIKRGFTFLKLKYNISPSGKIIRRLTRSGITRMRKKMRSFVRLVADGKITYDDVYNSMQSWLGHACLATSYTTCKHMLARYNQLFDGYKITRSYYKRNGGKKRVLQADKWSEYRWRRNAG